MAKRESVLLAHPLNLKKHIVAGSYMSDKYDGVRAWWDGGISRGLFADQVPWANTEKDHIRVKKPIATGLWSRYGNVIYAPDYFLDSLPPYFLDGELYAGPGKFQQVTSITGSYVPSLRWKQIQYIIFDSPNPEVILGDGVINNTNYKKTLRGCFQWAIEHTPNILATIPHNRYYDFRSIYGWLERNLPQDGYAKLAPQELLPSHTEKAIDRMNERLVEVLDAGGEGLVIRRASSMWLPERSHDVMKYKPYSDAEGTVVGYVWGRETALGSKLLGLMGALVLDFNGKRLELSGFTNDERELQTDDPYAQDEQFASPGLEVSKDWINSRFPIGSRVTFKYRELTDAGIPKEARYFRKRPNE